VLCRCDAVAVLLYLHLAYSVIVPICSYLQARWRLAAVVLVQEHQLCLMAHGCGLHQTTTICNPSLLR
jgi:hypothetical protein